MKAIRTQAIITSFRSRSDRSLGAAFVTPELSIPEKVSFMELQGINVEMLIYPKDSKDADVIEIRKEMDAKSPTQIQRGVLFLIWKRLGEQQTFDAFYSQRMSAHIERLKAELDEA